MALTVLSLLFPITAFADLNGTVTLPANTSIKLDTGATASSGGDLLWNGSTLAPQGTAKALNASVDLSFSGASGFSGVNQQILQVAFSIFGSSAPVSSLAVNTVVGVLTNGGNDAKLLVTALSGTSITLQYTTFGVTAPPPPTPTGPAITQLQNNYSYILPGLPNYGIAPGTLFIIQGANLASTTNAVVQNSAGSGIPLSLNGASVAVTVNGVTTHPGMYYAISTQIAAVLPSSTPIGTGTITVTFNGTTSPAAPITVVQSALGFDSYLGTGIGLGVATDPTTGSLFYYNQSAKPGQTIVLWGSGLGANTADSDTVLTTTPHAVNAPLTIYIGGIAAQILYQGGSGYPGVNQINVAIPANVSTGCAVSVAAVSGTITSNTVTIPIDPSGGVCKDAIFGTSGAEFVTFTGKTNLTSGSLIINQANGSNFAGAVFLSAQNSIASLLSASAGSSVGGCVLNSALNVSTTIPTPAGPDAGNITITGPDGSAPLQVVPSASGGSSGIYNTPALTQAFIPPTGGSFTFQGSGGKDVGPFTASVSYTSLMNWTNMSASGTVTRSLGLPIAWTGASANSFVSITGSSTTPTAVASFTCSVPAGADQFTIPSYILQALPPGKGSLSVINVASITGFSATGIDGGVADFSVSLSITSTYN
ncbi:MAG TPA: hypothetical protein VK752_00295 [Bryobacteraceae bacterium]|nr:hypothetical protein [Bryobacteraceae bacterium]